MLKRFFTYFVLAVGVLQSTGANATDLDRAFSSLVGGNAMATGSGPSMQSTATRQVFVAGGIEARFPRSKGTVSLLSITPPTMPTAGCGGISAHFGGFSFVSGAQIEQLIKNIGQNAVGMVVSVVIKTLCPICDAVIQAMTKLAQDAAKLAVDSCAVATNIVNTVASTAAASGTTGSTGTNPALTSTVCGKNVSISGGSEDYLSAVQGIDSVCGSLSSAMAAVGKAIRKAEGKDGPAGEASVADKESRDEMMRDNAWGNTTWNALNAIYGVIETANTDEQKDDLRNRMLLMNVLGTEIITDKDEKATTYLPDNGENSTLSGKQLFELFMCGAPANYTEGGESGAWLKTRNTREYCKYFYGSPADKVVGGLGQNGGYSYWVYECPPADLQGNPNFKSCLHMRKVALKDSTMLKGVGFLAQTEILLSEAVEAVRTNKKGGFDPRFLALANSVNFPIYQAVNAAAVYPASTADLMSTMSVLVAESLVYAKLEEVVRPQGKNADRMTIKRDLALRVYDVLENMNKMHLAQKESYGRMMSVQEGAVHSIRQINLAIQKQVMTPELLGNNKMSAAMANSVTESK
jgi:hypothetical protein